MYKVYATKHILNVHKHVDGAWFWTKYSAYAYVGCELGCVYCYCRDEKYNPHKADRDSEVLNFQDPFSEYIKIKENAPELLRKALAKKPYNLIYIHGYEPVENRYQFTRKMLEVCLKVNFPVFINAKSPLVLRDLDLLKKINKRSYANVGWSIITASDDETRKVFEPLAPPVAGRFAAMKKLAVNGITTGTVLMPVLPFIYDSEKNIEAVVKKTRESGGQYVLDGGLTLWGYCGTYYYRALEKYNPTLVGQYQKLYGNPRLLGEYTAKVHHLVQKYCRKYGLVNYIPRPVNFFPQELQVNKQMAADLFLQAREILMSEGQSYHFWAYQKAAWVIDEMEESLADIYHAKGLAGLLDLPAIGKKFAAEIEEKLKSVS